MNIQTRSFIMGLCSTLLSLMPALGSSAPLDISSKPLFTTTAVEPNVFFVVDDSLSMEMDQMNADLKADGQYVIGSLSYRFLIPMGAAYHIGDATILPSQQAIVAHNLAAGSSMGIDQLHSDADGVWRTRNHNFNRLYYNPDITYRAWQGVNSANAAYSSSIDPHFAPWNPYDASSGVLDLTALLSWNSSVTTATGGFNTVAVSDYYIPRYYAWTDTNSNGVVDPNDAHTLHEIRTTGCSFGATCSASYTRPASRTDCATPGTCTVAEELQNFANWWIYHRTRDKVVKAALSEVIALGKDVRMGMSTTHNNATRYELASMSAANKSGLMAQLFQYQGSSPGTPLKAALERAGNYFACGGSAKTADTHFSYYPAGGVANSISSSNNLFSNTNCPIDSNPLVGKCQQNFAVLITDGFDSPHGELHTWNGLPAAPADPDWSGTVAGSANNVRLYNDPFTTASSVNADADGNSAFDGASYADSYSDTLADVAMHFYEKDLSSHVNQVPTQAGVDENNAQHMVTFGVSFGLQGSLPLTANPTDAGFAWPDPSLGNAQKIDDLRHATYNGRGKFFAAGNPQELSDALDSSVKSVADRIGSASAVAFNTSTLSTDSNVYLALFNSTRWSGDLISYALNPNTGIIDTTASWRAADLLDAKSWVSRKLYTWNGSTGVLMDSFAKLTPAQQADLNMGPSGVSDGLGVARLNYLRGDRSDENKGNFFRIRNSVLGDIVHSGPVYVGEPNLFWPDVAPFPTGVDSYSEYKQAQASRTGMLYVGSNDGSLHAFDAATGAEQFAYVPNMVFSSAANQGLHYLTDPTYGHRYYVDQTPTVSDVFVNGGWKTVLVGAMRGGARGIFTLDITDPGSFSTTNVMHEFTSAVNAELGYTFSQPVIALTNASDGTNNRFAVIFGNGYNAGGSGRPGLFVVFLDADLSDGWQQGTTAADDYMFIPVPALAAYGDTTTPNGLSSPAVIDTDGNGTADVVYAGDLKGNLWSFNISGTWDVRGGAPLFSGSQAITAVPAVAKHATAAGTAVVLFGTGSYMTTTDDSDNQAGEFYGIFDDYTATPSTITDANLHTRTLTDYIDYRLVSNGKMTPSKKGWKIQLQAYERVVTRPAVRGDVVYFNTTIPDSSQPCEAGGSGWLMAVNYMNGDETPDPVFDYNADNIVSVDDKVVDGGGALHSAAGKKFNQGLPASSAFLGDMRYTAGTETNTGGEVNATAVINLDGPGTGRLSWEQLKR